MKQKLKNDIQMLGRSLLLPIAIMAPIGMILGVSGAFAQGYMIEKLPILGNSSFQLALKSLKTISGVIFSNLPLLFCMAVAYGMSKKEKGISVYTSVISYLTLTVTMKVWLIYTGGLVDTHLEQAGQTMVLGIQTLRTEAMGGIICGVLAAKMTDRYSRIELPVVFAFFSGKRFVPIITFLATVVVGSILPFTWTIFTKGMISLSGFFMYDTFGSGLYIMMNRALIPFGLHHILSSLIRYTEAGGVYMIHGVQYVGVLPAMQKLLFDLGPNDPAWIEYMPKLSSYLAGSQMLTTLFRIPAIGLAMYHTAKSENKKIAKGIILACVLTPFLGNVTEPMEFSFLFISPPLYICYVILSGLMVLPMQFLQISIGYIRGTIFDFTIFGLMYENTNWINLVFLGLFNSIVFYSFFRWFILKYNLKTPGREENLKDNNLLKTKNYHEIARLVIEGLGGKNNVKNVDNCVTRLRIDLVDTKIMVNEIIEKSGSRGVFIPQKNHVHIVFGPHVEFVKNGIDDIINQ
ncbi:MAG: PTS transporter subunit EIIC [Psychrilyobacter sp.]|uniref:PTS transporter subunit EIIC n=1 Tax=Psychrilyobacter sp. TaxID=2586924 RepID=UPI003C75FDA0